MRFLRLEKMIPFWGEELTSETTPSEVGRSGKVRFDKAADFIGKRRLESQRDHGVYRRLVQVQLDAPFDKDRDPWPWTGEAFYRDGQYVGHSTNVAYGITLDKMVCLGFVQHPDTINGKPTVLDVNWLTDKQAKWEINVAGRMIPASVLVHPPKVPTYDELRRAAARGGR